MTWRELVHAICLQIPDEQFDDEAKITIDDHYFSVVSSLVKNEQNWYCLNNDRGIVSASHPNKIGEPIIKQGEWTIE